MLARTLALMAVVVYAASSAAALDTPRLQTVRYVIHTDPGDPDSPVKMQVELLLERELASGSAIGWRVQRIELRKPDGAGFQVWTKDQPPLGTADGLWWVAHADPETPETGEFTLPPALSGTAAAVGALDEILVYSIESVPYTPPAQGPPWPVTAALTYSFTDAAAAPVVEPAVNEPSEVPTIGLE